MAKNVYRWGSGEAAWERQRRLGGVIKDIVRGDRVSLGGKGGGTLGERHTRTSGAKENPLKRPDVVNSVKGKGENCAPLLREGKPGVEVGAFQRSRNGLGADDCEENPPVATTLGGVKTRDQGAKTLKRPREKGLKKKWTVTGREMIFFEVKIKEKRGEGHQQDGSH